MPVGQPHRMLRSLSSTEKAGRGAFRPSMSLVTESTWHSTPACLKISRAKSYQEHWPSAGHVVEAEVFAIEQPHDPSGEMPGVGRAADLVASRPRPRRGPREAEHRLDEVAPADPEQPRGADDEVARVGGRGLELAGELRLAVDRDRADLVGLDVRPSSLVPSNT